METRTIPEVTADARASDCPVSKDGVPVLAANCSYWGPRWTQGPRASDVAALRAQGVKTIYWTMDDPSLIDKFLLEGHPDGILSDYPGLVMERVQVLQVASP